MLWQAQAIRCFILKWGQIQKPSSNEKSPSKEYFRRVCIALSWIVSLWGIMWHGAGSCGL